METSDLPNIGRPARAALRAAGIMTLAEVADMREADLCALHGVGPKAVRILSEALTAAGLSFAD